MAKRIIRPREVEQPCCGRSTVISDLIYGRATIPGGCVDTPVDMVVNGDFSSAVPAFSFLDDPSLLTNNAWYYNDDLSPGSGDGTISRVGNAMKVLASTGSDAKDYYLFNHYDGGATTIDSTVEQTFSIDVNSVTVRGGKGFMAVTLQDPVANKYYQIDITAQPYGTFVVVIDPADWTPGLPPPYGIIDANYYISIYVSMLGIPDGIQNDDFTIDNVSLTHIECV